MRILAAALVAFATLGPAAAQPPPPSPPHGPDMHRDHGPGDRRDWHHHRRCRTVWHHGHRVRRCY